MSGELRNRLSAIAKRNWADPEYRTRVLAKRQATLADPARHAAFVTACREAAKNPETNARRAAKMKAAWSCSDYRKRVMTARAQAAERPEVRLRRAEASRSIWQRSDYKERISARRKEAWRNPAIRQRILQSRTAFHLRRLGLQPKATTWARALASAANVDPDLVLRGDREARLAMINDLRAIEGVGPFVLTAA